MHIISASHKKYTVFATRNGQYEFNRMPFGLSGAPFTFQRLMNTILRKENWQICLIYLDDILIFSKTFEEHMKRLDAVLSKLHESGIKLSPKKCNFFMSELCYLGHKISRSGIETDPSKISVLRKWPIPSTIHELRSFLGFTNYYRRFINHYSELTKNLEELIKGNVKDNQKLNMDGEHIRAFKNLIEKLTSAPILTFPNKDDTFILDTDASGSALGAVLSQRQNGIEKL